MNVLKYYKFSEQYEILSEFLRNLEESIIIKESNNSGSIEKMLKKYKNLQISINDKTGKIYVKKMENIEIEK
jgi:uncharacterized protein YheU (UPF0270 family)